MTGIQPGASRRTLLAIVLLTIIGSLLWNFLPSEILELSLLRAEDRERTEKLRRADELRRRAMILRRTTYDMDSIRYYLTEARTTYSKLYDWYGVVQTYYNQAECIRHISNDLETVRNYIDTALALCRERADSGRVALARAWCYNVLAKTYSGHWEIDSAIQYYGRSIHLALDRRVDSEERHKLLHDDYYYSNLLYQRLRDSETALECLELCLPHSIAAYGERSFQVAAVYNGMGNCVGTGQSDLEKALKYYNHSYDIKRELFGESHRSVANTCYGIAGAFYHKQELDQALMWYRKAQRIYREALGTSHLSLFRVYRMLAMVQRSMGEFNAAHSSLDSAEAILARLQLPPEELRINLAEIPLARGFVFTAMKETDSAMAAFNRTLSLIQTESTKTSFHKWKIVEAYSGMAQCYQEQGAAAKALEYFDRCIQLARGGSAYGSRDTSARSLSTKAYIEVLNGLNSKADVLLATVGDKADSLSILKQVLDLDLEIIRISESMRLGSRSESSKIYFASELLSVFERGIKTSQRLMDASGGAQYADYALHFMEQNKSFLFWQSILNRRAKGFAAIPDSILRYERRLKYRLAFWEDQYNASVASGAAKDSSEAAAQAELHKVLLQLQREYEQLINSLEKDYPVYYEVKYQTEASSLDSVRHKLLGEQDAVVEYFVGDSSLYALVITAHTCEILTSELDSNFRTDIQRLRQGIVEHDFPLYTRYAHRLYQVLFEPLEPKFEGAKILIIPDDVLTYVPFEALLTKPISAQESDYSVLPYLIKRFQIAYSYSAALALKSGRFYSRTNESGDVLGGFAPKF